MSEKEYIKVSLSKCYTQGHKDYKKIRFTCIVCKFTYKLEIDDCNGIICCECSDAINDNYCDEFTTDYLKELEKESYDILEMMEE